MRDSSSRGLGLLCSLEFSTQRQERASTGTHNPKQIVFLKDPERGIDRAWLWGPISEPPEPRKLAKKKG